MVKLTGHCLCGAVTSETGADVLCSGHCNCDNYRRATTAPMVSFFGVPRDSVMWAGKMAATTNSEGQVCSAMSRVIVHDSIHDELVERVVGVAKSLNVGRGIDQPEFGRTMGAMVSDKQCGLRWT